MALSPPIFKTTDFVQVEMHQMLEGGEPSTFWRNALYVGLQGEFHSVIFTDGTKLVLNKNILIRRAE